MSARYVAMSMQGAPTGSLPPFPVKTLGRYGSTAELTLRRKPRRMERLMILHATASSHKVSRARYNRMKKDRLIGECEKLKLDSSGTRAELVDRIWTHVSATEKKWTKEELMRLKAKELQQECVSKNLPKWGTKAKMAERLMESQQSDRFLDTVKEMEQRLADSGKLMKERAQTLIELAGEHTSKPDPVPPAEIPVEPSSVRPEGEELPSEEPKGKRGRQKKSLGLVGFQRSKDDFLKLFTRAKASRGKKGELVELCSQWFPDKNLKKMTRVELLDLIFETPSETAPPQLEPDLEPQAEPDPESKEETEGMARMMLLDQIKVDRGSLFKGDIEGSIDSLLNEMRCVYGAYIPVEMDDPLDYFDDDEIEELRSASSHLRNAEPETDAEESLEAEPEQETALEPVAEAENELTEPEAELEVEDELPGPGVEAAVEDLESWPESPMGGPDMDELDIPLSDLTEDELPTQGSDLVEAASEDPVGSPTVKGTRRRRQERSPEPLDEEEEDPVERYLTESNVDLKPSFEEREAVAKRIMQAHVKQELLEMSESKFSELVQPLNMDVGRFRELFVRQIMSLAGIKEAEAEPKTDLIEMSLSTMDPTYDEMEVREKLANDVEFEGAPVISMTPSVLDEPEEDIILTPPIPEPEPEPVWDEVTGLYPETEVLPEEAEDMEEAGTQSESVLDEQAAPPLPESETLVEDEVLEELKEVPKSVEDDSRPLSEVDTLPEPLGEALAKALTAPLTQGLNEATEVTKEERTFEFELSISTETEKLTEEAEELTEEAPADESTEEAEAVVEEAAVDELTEDVEEVLEGASDEMQPSPEAVLDEQLEATKEEELVKLAALAAPEEATKELSTADIELEMKTEPKEEQTEEAEMKEELTESTTEEAQLDTAEIPEEAIPVDDDAPSVEQSRAAPESSEGDISTEAPPAEEPEPAVLHSNGFEPPVEEPVETDTPSEESPVDVGSLNELYEKPAYTEEETASEETPALSDASDLALKNIERVLSEIKQQRQDYETSLKSILPTNESNDAVESLNLKKEQLSQDIDHLSSEFEGLKQKVDRREEEIIELRDEINRVLIEYELLPFVPLIGDGNGEFGVFGTYEPSPHFSNSYSITLDEESYDYSISPRSSFSPSDPAIRNQYHNNLTSASETEIFLRSGSDEKEPVKKPPTKKDPLKKHSSIAVGLAFGVTEFCKKVFPNLFDPKREEA